ncbi:unnamed protein product [Rhodiola kirilowii]
MEQPLGYISKSHPGYVCKLKKALYGLKQAPRAWFGKIAEFLQFCGYHSTDVDSSIFVKKNGDVHMVVLLYVDDMIVTGSREGEDEIARLRGELSTRFDTKNLGVLSHFLGLEVKRVTDGILLSQEGYANNLIERYKLKPSKNRFTPLDTSEKLRRFEGAPLPDFMTYRSLVGGLLYLTITRPDIADSVGLISRYLQEPRKPHLEAAKKILKYVISTIDFCLFYKRRDNFHLQGYTDADFDGDLDERKSTSGYVFMCNDTSVSWGSKKQDAIALSTTEAEYKAATLAAQKCVWLRRLIDDLHHQIQKAIDLFGDNQSAIKLAHNPICHARTKHIEIEHHFIREKVLDGTIITREVRSESNIADILMQGRSRSSSKS